MLATSGAAERARWEIIVVVRKRVQRKAFGADLAGALTLMGKAQARGMNTTLRCCNVAFPPPANLQPHTRTVRLKGKKKPTAVHVTPLRKLNREGVWWCPYCMKLRRFVRRKNFVVAGVKIVRPVYCCPLCEASHRDSGVQKWNPLAWEIALREDNRTRANGKAKDE